MERRTFLLVGVLATIGLAGIDGTVVATVMPVALGDLGAPELYAWGFAAYMLATAVTMPIWGPGSDRWGRRRTYLAGIGVFILGSVACAVAPTMPVFIAARALQGAGAGAVMSLPFIVLGVVFPPERRARALGVVASAWAISSVAGPLLGTAIVASASWRWVFLLNLPIGLVAAWLVRRGMDESVGEAGGRFDLVGSLLAGGGGAALIASFVRMGDGLVGPVEAALAAGGVAALLAFVRHEGRAERPILPLEFFRHAGYAAAMGASFASAFAAFALAAYLPLRVMEVFASNAITGLVVGVFTIAWSGAALASGRFVHRAGERAFVLSGAVVLAASGLALMVAFPYGVSAVAAGGALAGLGMGLMTPSLTVAVQNSVEVRRMGSATTSQQFTRQVGAALGIGTFGLLTRLAGFEAALAALVVAAAVTLGFGLFLPRTSLASPRPAPQPDA